MVGGGGALNSSSVSDCEREEVEKVKRTGSGNTFWLRKYFIKINNLAMERSARCWRGCMKGKWLLKAKVWAATTVGGRREAANI